MEDSKPSRNDTLRFINYASEVAEVGAELRVALDAALAAGVAAARIVIDPGIGFAKRPTHSYGLLARIDELVTMLDRPILAGPSRKSFMREALKEISKTLAETIMIVGLAVFVFMGSIRTALVPLIALLS